MKAPARRQPKGLYVLLCAEMCERFSFYTLVYLLALYLTNDRGMTDRDADLVYGAYTSLVYLATVGGGFLADGILGFRRAIILGALVSVAGFALLIPGNTLYLGLAALVAGSGLFKVNITSLLGRLYDSDVEHRDSGFSLYYMGINAGSFAASLGSGYVATQYGYAWAFALAGAGELLALTIFVFGQRYLRGEGMPPQSRWSAHGSLGLALITGGIVVAIGAISLPLRLPGLAGGVLTVLSLLALSSFIAIIAREPAEQRRRLTALLVLFLFAVVFWAVYGQSGISVLLYIERGVDRDVFGGTIPATAFLSLNSIFVLLSAPVFAWLWLRLARRHIDPSVPAKFVIGLVSLGLSFFVLKLGGTTSGTESLTPPIWLVAFFFLLTVGEMCVSPIGLSLVSRLAPARLLGFTMGMWFLAEAVADYLSGFIATIAAVPAGDTLDAATKTIYEHAFGDYGWFALAGAAALLTLVGLIRRLMTKPQDRGGGDTDAPPRDRPATG